MGQGLRVGGCRCGLLITLCVFAGGLLGCQETCHRQRCSVSPASKGLLDAAHFCYLMAQVGFGAYTKKTAKLVLIGSSHR